MEQNMTNFTMNQVMTIKEFNAIVRSRKLKTIVNKLYKQDPNIKITYHRLLKGGSLSMVA